MKLHLFIYLFFIVIIPVKVFAQDNNILKGRVISKESGKAIELATVVIKTINKWDVTNAKGEYSIKHLQSGKYNITVTCLGYKTIEQEIWVSSDSSIHNFEMEVLSLGLNEVKITAELKEEQSTTYTITSTALEHEQVLDVSQIQSLLPGGKTSSKTSLVGSQQLHIHNESTGEMGNASFGTAIEVDGVRLQNNASFNSFNPSGIDTRSISTVNIESIEVTTGIASVEHGDLTNGIVKINTLKGRTPLKATVSINPQTKQFGLSKGFALKNDWGTLNVSGEHARSFSNLMSPHTTYERNGLSLTHEKHFKNHLILTTGFTLNVGGYNNEDDPDLFTGTYAKNKDNVIRGNIAAKWFLNKKWINNLWFSTSVNYSDKLAEERKNKSAAGTSAANHATETGYFLATDYDENPNAPIKLLPTGYWYETRYYDSKQIDFAAKIKADKVNTFENYTNKILLGIDYSNSGNFGKGTYYDDMRYAPDWQSFVLSEVPHTNNLALYLENKLTRKLNEHSKLTLTAGVRSDNTYISQSEYAWVGNISPRANIKYTQNNGTASTVRSYNFYAGWGKSVKLPSMGVLNPRPTYSDTDVFASTSNSNNVSYIAYYNQASTTLYNPGLKYQYNNHIQIGFGANIKGTKISVSAYRKKTINPYIYENIYTPYSYNRTEITALESSMIPVDERRFTIDETTGIVTVHDASGQYASYPLEYEERSEFLSRIRYANGSSVTRMGLDWMIDFPEMKALSTSVRIDGNYYYYKGVEEHVTASRPAVRMANGEPFKYVGHYIGSESSANGRLSKRVNTNITIKTHIPKVRMVVTLRIESSLYNYSRNLSEYSGGNRGFILEDQADYFGDDINIYDRNEYVGIYPIYYTTWEDMDTKIPFEERFKWAKENDPALYTELSRLVVKTGYKNFFKSNKISAYYSANIKVTKEIGNIGSVSFFARNFARNMETVRSTRVEGNQSLYRSYLPDFHYGISMRIKL
ncbi:carboxypeptidase-like regulatory domain-containing protein [Ancylomarina sp. DW003]|nr:carboxypeptidase-like regulatory domain-containing protein [Ancylomarina sp. DW003]MDE5421143.1 carboxypeptidase-like regulatory domain-containing protein [Ancylomarina sp. DW003]